MGTGMNVRYQEVGGEVILMAWLRNLNLDDLEVISRKEHDGKTYTYLAKRLENGAVVWACVVRGGDQERVVERGVGAARDRKILSLGMMQYHRNTPPIRKTSSDSLAIP